MRMLRRLWSDESGNILVMTGFGLVGLMSFLALAIDAGNLYYSQRQLQTLADSAAMAGALEADVCPSTTNANCLVMQNAAKAALQEDGIAAANITLTPSTQCTPASAPAAPNILLTLNNSPCYLASGDPNAGDVHYVEAVVSEQVPTFFATLFGIDSVPLSARAEAGKASPSACMIILSQSTSSKTLNLNAGASIKDGPNSNCGIWVDGQYTKAAEASTSTTVNVGFFDVVGGAEVKGTSNPAPTTGASYDPDPFASIPAPAVPVTSTTNYGNFPGQAGKDPSFSVPDSNGNIYLHPGNYTGFNCNGGTTINLKLAPGLYYFSGPVNGGSCNFTGSDVTLYFGPKSQFQTNSTAIVSISASTTAAAAFTYGTVPGILVWQDRSNSSGMILDAGTNSTFGGAIYVPDANLEMNGGSMANAGGMVVAYTFDANSPLTLSCSTMPGGECAGGGGSGDGSAKVALAE